MNAQAQLTPPEVNRVWPGQGGIYMGLIQYPEGLCHVIAADKDLPVFYAFGGYGESVEATSRTDGRANTQILLARDGKHPAAIAAAAYTADGHSDFALPSIGELHRFWQVAPESFSTDWYYWSSSQRSAYSAFDLHFGVGYQGSSVKGNELRVRPVRRFLQ